MGSKFPALSWCVPAADLWSHAYRFQYEEEVRKNPLNYDNWFDYIKLEEDAGDEERVREV